MTREIHLTMVEFYSRQKRFLLALDVIIFGFDEEGLKLLLIKRGFEPCKGQWSLMGGFLEENEDMEQAADRVLHKLTGLSDLYLEQLHLYSKPPTSKSSSRFGWKGDFDGLLCFDENRPPGFGTIGKT